MTPSVSIVSLENASPPDVWELALDVVGLSHLEEKLIALMAVAFFLYTVVACACLEGGAQ